MNELKDRAVEMLRTEGNPGKVRAWLVYEGGLNENEARKAVNQLMSEIGMAKTVHKTNWEAVVRTCRENDGMSGKELAQLVADESGCKLSSARHYVSLVAMCKEWARQENGQ